MKRIKTYLWLQFVAIVFLAGCHTNQHRVPADTAKNIMPLTPGDRLPQICLNDSKGKTFNLNDSISKKPAVLIFYRGGWCPFCTEHLAGLQSVAPELITLGYQLIAISPDRPALLAPLSQEKGLNYKLLSDSSMKVGTAMGIAFRLDDATFKKYKTSYNIDIEADSGYTHHLLPVPAVFIVGTDGIVKYTYTDPNYKERLSPELILKVAKRNVE